MNAKLDVDSDKPSSTQPPSIPYGRTWKIALRTLHLIVTYLLFAGHALNTPAGQLRFLLYAAIVTGIGMGFLEAYPSAQALVQGWGLVLVVKLALLASILFAWNYRLPILIAVVALAAVGSHMPGRYRHYSFLHGRVIKPS